MLLLGTGPPSWIPWILSVGSRLTCFLPRMAVCLEMKFCIGAPLSLLEAGLAQIPRAEAEEPDFLRPQALFPLRSCLTAWIHVHLGSTSSRTCSSMPFLSKRISREAHQFPFIPDPPSTQTKNLIVPFYISSGRTPSFEETPPHQKKSLLYF